MVAVRDEYGILGLLEPISMYGVMGLKILYHLS